MSATAEKDASPGDHDSEQSTVISDDTPEPMPQERTIDVIPDGGYGWVCVSACALINAHTWGINSVMFYQRLSACNTTNNP